jgi:hypothetical protein
LHRRYHRGVSVARLENSSFPNPCTPQRVTHRINGLRIAF